MRVITETMRRRAICFTGNQIRLYQSVDNYLLLAIDDLSYTPTLYSIPHSKLYQHYINGDIAYSSSHISGNSINKANDIRSVDIKREWGITLNNKFDWSLYAITETDL